MATYDNDTDVVTKIKPNLSVVEPPLYKVIYMNDDKTSFEFVIDSLVTIFDHTQESAIDVAHEVHEKGSSVVAVLHYEIAEQKTLEVTAFARSNGFPLKVKIEEDR